MLEDAHLCGGNISRRYEAFARQSGLFADHQASKWRELVFSAVLLNRSKEITNVWSYHAGESSNPVVSQNLAIRRRQGQRAPKLLCTFGSRHGFSFLCDRFPDDVNASSLPETTEGNGAA
jgi:hypothetical protein